MKPLHICYVCSEYPPSPHGGIGSFTQTLSRALVGRGHRVTVVGLYPEQHAGGDTVDEGVQVIRLSRRGLPLVRFLTNRGKLARRLRELHAAHPIDIIEGGELELCQLNRSAPGIKILRMHGGPTFFNTGIRIQVWKESWAFRVADELCAVSRSVGEGTRQMLGLGDRHIEVIYNPVDTALFAPQPPGGAEAEIDGLIVFTGTITERKGIRQLIQAMPRVVREVPHARLEVYGGEAIEPAPPVSFQETLQRLLPPDIASRVSWMGRVPRKQLPLALRRASVCVYPSHIEAMSIGWLEGLASGKAVAASRTGPGPEVIDDGKTGLLFDPHDPEDIAQIVIRLLKNPDLRKRLGTNARTSMQERFELGTIVTRNEEYYLRVSMK